MAAAVRNKQDLYSLLGVDYIIAPLKVLESLKESVTSPDEKYAFARKLSPQSAAAYEFSTEEEVLAQPPTLQLNGKILKGWRRPGRAARLDMAAAIDVEVVTKIVVEVVTTIDRSL